MDTLRFYDILDDQFGDNRPTTNDFIIVDESNHQIIIEWREDSLSVNLYLWPHSEFQGIIPETADGCEYYDGEQDNPSHLTDLPETYVDEFTAAVGTLKDKYTMDVKDSMTPVSCRLCLPGDETDGTLVFTRRLTED